MRTETTRPMNTRFPKVLFPLILLAAAGSPLGAQAANDGKTAAVNAINDGLNSNEGGTLVTVIKDTTDHGLNTASLAHQGTAWRGDKLGASSSTVGGHLAIRDNLKNASNLLNKGGILIDHAGYTSTAAGELVEGQYAQGFITILDGVGKWLVSGAGASIGASVGSLAGPAGTISGGAAGGYAGSNAWDSTIGSKVAELKKGLAEMEAKRQFRALSGPKMLGQTADGIHATYAKYLQGQEARQRLRLATAAAKETPPPKGAKGKMEVGSAAAVYDPYKGGGDNIRVTLSPVGGFKATDAPGWRNNGTSFNAFANAGDAITIQGTIVTKPWSYFDFNNSITIKADGQVVFSQAPKIAKEGGSASFSFTFDPHQHPQARSLEIRVSSIGGNPEFSTHWVGGTIQIGN